MEMSTVNWWKWCYSTPSERCGHEGTPWRPNSRATPQGLGQRSKIEEVVPKMASGEALMWDSQGRGEPDPAEGGTA